MAAPNCYSLIETLEAFTGELAFDRLLVNLVRVCREAADAERAVLVLDDEGELVQRATATAEGEPRIERRPIAVSATPPSVVEHVFRSKEILVLGDAARAGRFAADPYISEHGVRSILAVPVVRGDRVHGVLYCEDNLASDAFSPELAELFRLLSAPMASALDNASLHRDLQEVMRQRQERDRYLRLIFGQMPGAVWAVDRSLRITYVTGRVLNLAGLDEGDLVGTSVYDFLGTRDPAEPAIARHLAVLNGARRSFEYQFRDRWYAVVIEPVRDAGRRIVGCLGAALDITERLQTAERLAQSERRLSEAQQVAHVGSFEWEIQLDRLTWSDELQRIYGFEPGQFGGTFDAFLARIPPDEVESTRQIIFDALTRGTPFQYDHRIARTDGSVRMLRSRGGIITDEQGRPIRMVGTCWDVTEQSVLIAKLEDAVSRWEATVNATSEGILVVDLSREVSATNRRFLTLWGLPVESAEGLAHLDLLSPAVDELDDKEAFLDRVGEIYGNQEHDSFDVIHFKDGRVFEQCSRPQRIGGKIAGRVWSVRDVTERERLLHQALFLADATRLLASLDVEPALDRVAHLAVPYLGDGCAIDLLVDGEPRRLVAVSRDPQRPICPEIHPTVLGGNQVMYREEDRFYLAVPMLVKGRFIGAITLAASRRRYTDAELELVDELGSRAALAVENARLYRRAQDALRARDEFLSIAAHEIRGPIQSIHVAVQAIRRSKVPPETYPKLLEIVERQDRRLAQLVDQLLDLGRFRAGRLLLDYQDVNLGEVVRDVAVRFGPELARSGSSLTVTAGQIVGQWDKGRLDQVVSNLLSNAIKFGLGKPIELAVEARDGNAVLVVKDHGVGIEPEMQKRLFEPFERGVSIRHYGGLGLGLHITKTIVEALGGSVFVESEPGAGSTFVVELPRAREGASEDAHPDH